ncbi:MAG: AAA family ATPase [Pseudomonadota bacterium]
MSLRRILITGATGAGISSLAAEMGRRGYEVMREPGRRVIRAETRTNGTGLPWVDPARYARLCLRIAAADWEEARAGPVVFDRGALDAALALHRLGQTEAAEAALNAHRYDDVFLAPPWLELFETDEERRIDFAEASAEYDSIAEVLPAHGYAPVELPKADIVERADWLEARLKGG